MSDFEGSLDESMIASEMVFIPSRELSVYKCLNAYYDRIRQSLPSIQPVSHPTYDFEVIGNFFIRNSVEATSNNFSNVRASFSTKQINVPNTLSIAYGNYTPIKPLGTSEMIAIASGTLTVGLSDSQSLDHDELATDDGSLIFDRVHLAANFGERHRFNLARPISYSISQRTYVAQPVEHG